MNHHLTLPITGQQALDRSNTAEAVTNRTQADGQVSLAETSRVRPQLTLANAPVWRHKLILTGKLDDGSTPEFEEEIDCLFEEGVTALTLDLRQLDAIDSAGVTAVARRGAVCKMRGHDFAVIPGSRVHRHALVEAGATDLLAPDAGTSVVRRFPGRFTDDSAVYRSTAMIKSL
jgi:anti-anti-sigma regulatory factor